MAALDRATMAVVRSKGRSADGLEGGRAGETAQVCMWLWFTEADTSTGTIEIFICVRRTKSCARSHCSTYHVYNRAGKQDTTIRPRLTCTSRWRWMTTGMAGGPPPLSRVLGPR
jgi:hypothetical protein